MWTLQKINFMTTAAYKQNFLIMTISVAIHMAMNLIFLKVIFGYINNIAGWSYFEVLIVIGSVMIIDGVVWVFGARISALGRNIQRGLLDGMMIKPMDTQFLISFWQCDHEDFPRIVIGGSLVCYGAANLGLTTHAILLNLILYLILLFNATIIVYSFNMLIRTTYFWTIVDFSLHNVIEAFTDISKYPTDIFNNLFIKTLFTFLLPLAFVATVPTRVLAKGFDWRLVLGSFLMAAIFFALARKFWLFGLRHYKSASS